MAKRSFDIVIVSIGILVLWPLLLVIALVVRLDSPGSALFRQTRVGRHGREFQLLKFRTMFSDPVVQGPLLTVTGDPRITRFGAFLRSSKLDELPQLFNVLRGEMSLVGPRPEVPRFVAMYPTDVRDLVLSVRPGITDDASIEFRHESELLAKVEDPEALYVTEILPRKLKYYTDYAREHTLWKDVRTIWRTGRCVLHCTPDDLRAS
jgi:lipopolysaccharide/colanic/teichoic acid biosynthesis glycosyltransferase